MSVVSPLLPCPSCQTRNRLDLGRLRTSPKCGKCGTALPPPSSPVTLDDSTFQDAIKESELPVLVDFWATWCPPCRNFGPTLQSFAEKNAGKVLVVKVDVDNARQTASRMRIQGVPTLALFQRGLEVGRQVGALSPAELDAFVSRHANVGA